MTTIQNKIKSEIAERLELSTTRTNYLDFDTYDVDGSLFGRLRLLRRLYRFFRPRSPWYKMSVAAGKLLDNSSNTGEYDGSESVMSVLKDFGFDEEAADEFDQHLLYLLIDSSFNFRDVALINFAASDGEGLDDAFVNDVRGMESIVQQFAVENNIQPIYFNTKVRRRKVK